MEHRRYENPIIVEDRRAEQSKRSRKHAPRRRRIWAAGILAGVALALAVAVCEVLFYYTDVPIRMHGGPNVRYTFQTAGRRIALRHRDGGSEAFIVKGVGLSKTFAQRADHADFLRAFADIAALNANTVRVEDVMPPVFYQALSDHNASNREPLYLMQGVRLSDEAYAGMTDAYADGLAGKLIARGRLAIDAVHGARRGAATYAYDVSRYVVGFAVGNDWDSGLVLYTNMANARHAGRFSGRYIEVWDTSQAFETLLARVLNDLVAYETGKYNYQTPVGVQNGMRTDALIHTSDWMPGLYEVVTSVNTIHFKTKAAAKAGYFAAYHAETATMQFLSFDPAYNGYAGPDGRVDPYLGYLKKLTGQHPMPVIVTEVSASSARGVSGIDAVTGHDRGGSGEEGQAEILTALLTDIFDAGCAGGCVSTYEDDLLATAWNEAEYETANGNWKNVQDTEQNTGLVALDPGRPCRIDGDFSEWANVPVSATDGGDGALKYLYDEAYLYLHAQCPGFSATEDTVCIPLDLSPLSGGRVMDGYAFSLAADFVVRIRGTQQSRLYVHAYSDRLYFDKGREIWSLETKTHQPQKDGDDFHMLRQYVRPAMFDAENDLVEAITSVSGALVAADGGERSLSDFCFGEDGFELRIPWALLSITDPSSMTASGDLYATKKTPLPITGVGAELITTLQGETRAGAPAVLPLAGWGENAAFTPRKKPAYAAVKAVFESIP